MSSDLEKRVSDIQDTINRLSKNFDQFTSETLKKNGKSAKNEVIEMDDFDDGGQDFSKDENDNRGNWTGKLDFLLSCLGYAVGLGNVWRFPYLCYKNGGAVFFIPYVIMLAFVGMPIFMFELSIGQFTSSGALTCWNFAPLFKGIGVAMVIVSAMVGVYYNMIIAWAIWYLIASFVNIRDLVWSDCDNKWNSPNCWDLELRNLSLHCSGDSPKDKVYGMYVNESTGWCHGRRELKFGDFSGNFSDARVGINNRSVHNAMNDDDKFSWTLPTQEYLYNYMLKRYDYGEGKLIETYDMDNFGTVQWDLLLAYIAAWIIVFLSLCNGIKSSGKVVYFTALFPYVVLIILFVRGLLLEGHGKGIDFYITNVDFTKLEDSTVWKDAAVQIFFSLSASWGGLICLSSYNRFHNDCLRDTIIVSLGNCLTSFFAGFVIFSFLGFLAQKNQVSVADVADSGIGLAFTVYTYAVTKMPVESLWAILFFIMLITLGLDSEFALIETVTTSIIDQWESVLRPKKALVIFFTCLFFFAIGIPLCCNGGAHLLQLIDSYAGGWNVLLIALCEMVGIVYVYSGFRFCKDIQIMIGKSGCCGVLPWICCKWWWLFNWGILTPIGVLFVMIFSWVKYEKATWGDYIFPDWAEALGWLMTMAVVAGLIITPIVIGVMAVSRGESLRYLIEPTKYWGPALPKHRKLVDYAENFVIDPNDTEADLHDVKVGMQGQENLSYH